MAILWRGLPGRLATREQGSNFLSRSSCDVLVLLYFCAERELCWLGSNLLFCGLAP